MDVQYVKIPFLGTICAETSLGTTICGTPSVITISKNILKSKNKYYALMVSGDSMRHTHKDGETILVESTRSARKNDVVIARTQKGDTIKRVKNITKERITLVADNGETLPFSRNKVAILGIVVRTIEVEEQEDINLISKKIFNKKLPVKDKIIHGDTLIEMRKIPTASVDVIIADPPYNIGKDFGNNKDKKDLEEYVGWCVAWIDESLRCLKPDGTMFIYGFSEILAHLATNIQANKRWLVWHYTNKNVASLHFWQRSHEGILCVWKDKKPTFFRDAVREPYSEMFLKNSAGKVRRSKECRFSKGTSTTVYNAHEKGALPRDVIKVPALAGGAGKSERHFLCKTCNKVYLSRDLDKHRVHTILKHPTQKPFALTEKLINSCLNKKGLVLIPFAGSGSECLVAKQLGHGFIGIEINEEYIQLANGLLGMSNDYQSLLFSQ